MEKRALKGRTTYFFHPDLSTYLRTFRADAAGGLDAQPALQFPVPGPHVNVGVEGSV